jgi:hypothetical protein
VVGHKSNCQFISLISYLLRDKWTLFDESTHVPLLIAHPLSPYHGYRYRQPVELIDIYPTVMDILGFNHNRTRVALGLDMTVYPSTYPMTFAPLDGTSLYKILFGSSKLFPSVIQSLECNPISNHFLKGSNDPYNSTNHYCKKYALSQMIRCGMPESVLEYKKKPSEIRPQNVWFDCKTSNRSITDQIMIMGYSMRTISYRYTVWLECNYALLSPDWTKPIFDEELYLHTPFETGDDYGKLEIENVAYHNDYRKLLMNSRQELLHFIKNDIMYRRINISYFAHAYNDYT